MKELQILFILLLTVLSVNGQDGDFEQSKLGTGTLFGKVVSEDSPSGLAYANVAIYKAEAKTPQKVVTTKDGGRFIFRNLPFGKYQVAITFLGMGKYTSDLMDINKQRSAVKLGTITLEPDNGLEEIEVTGEKVAEQMDLVTKRFNVAQDINSTGGNALDVMRNIPALHVNVDGQIQLRGSSNVKILINGRPSSLIGTGSEMRLDQIPAASIEAIEVVTNPSAKYEAAGKAGVINIIMKRPSELGFNYSFNFLAGNDDKWNTGIDMNYRTKKWNWRAGYQFKRTFYHTYKDLNRQNIFADTTNFLVEHSLVDKLKIGHTYSFGIDWNPSKKTEIFTTLSVNPHTGQKSSTFNYTLFNKDNQYDSNSIRKTQDDEAMGGLQVELGVNQRFARKGMKWNSVYSLDLGTKADSVLSGEDFFFEQDILVHKVEKNRRDQIVLTHLFKSDFTYPVTKNTKIETGINYSLRGLNNDFKYFDKVGSDWISNADRTNDLLYQENIGAAYLMATTKWNHWDLNVGLRVEHTDVTTELAKATEKFPKKYANLFPSGHIAYEVLPDGKGKMMLSYSKRIKRPTYRQLNPFVSYNDNKNIRRGNPLLNPALTDSWELGWQTHWKKGSISPVIFYRYTDNKIGFYTHILPNGIRELTFKNLNHSISQGVELNGSYNPLKWFRLSGNISYYKEEKDGTNLDNSITNDGDVVMFRLMTSFTPIKPMSIQLSSFYHSGYIGVVGQGDPMTSTDFGMTYKVFKNRGQLIFKISDIFNTNQFAFHVNTKDIKMDFTRKRETRVFWLGFNWELKQAKKKRRRSRGGHGGGMEF